jgi:hypothetical protein
MDVEEDLAFQRLEDVLPGNLEREFRQAEGCDVFESIGAEFVEGPGDGINEPDVGGAPGTVFAKLFHKRDHAVVGREDLDDDKRGSRREVAGRERTTPDGEVRDADEVVGEADAEFRHGEQRMSGAPTAEEEGEFCLDEAVGFGRHGSFKNFSVDKFAVLPIECSSEVLVDAEQRPGCHDHIVSRRAGGGVGLGLYL